MIILLDNRKIETTFYSSGIIRENQTQGGISMLFDEISDFYQILAPLGLKQFAPEHSAVKHDDKKASIELEMPGAKKEDITLDYIDGKLRVAAKYRGRQTEEYFIVPERKFDVDKISASLADGLLTLEIPRREGAARKQIEIRSTGS
jgi:HSP20 family molecular chaperone IbpA